MIKNTKYKKILTGVCTEKKRENKQIKEMINIKREFNVAKNKIVLIENNINKYQKMPVGLIDSKIDIKYLKSKEIEIRKVKNDLKEMKKTKLVSSNEINYSNSTESDVLKVEECHNSFFQIS